MTYWDKDENSTHFEVRIRNPNFSLQNFMGTLHRNTLEGVYIGTVYCVPTLRKIPGPNLIGLFQLFSRLYRYLPIHCDRV